MPRKKKTRKTSNGRSLRKRAEELLRTKPSEVPNIPTADAQALIQELNIHQVELELQNEDLRQARAELAEARDRYADLYEFAPVGCLSLDKNGVILAANLTAARLLKVDRGTMPGRNISKFVARTSQDDCFLHRRATLAGDERQATEIEMLQPDGKVLPIRLESIAFGEGKHRHCRTALMDISHEKDTETILRHLNINLSQSLTDRTRELRDNVKRLQLLSMAMAHLAEGVIITDGEMAWPGPRIQFVNEAMCRISGYSSDELIGKAPRILQGKDTDRATLTRLKSELSAGHSASAELINYRRDGTVYHVDLLITPLHNASGQLTNFVCVNRDITERKEAESRLRASEQALSSFFDDAPIGLMWVGQDTRITRVNRAQMAMLGRSETELLNHFVREFAASDDLNTLLSKQAASGENIRNFKAHFLNADHTTTHVLIDATAVMQGTHFVRSEWFARDITRRVELESEVSNISEREQRRIGQDLHDDLCQMLTGIGFRCDTLAKALKPVSEAGSHEAGAIARAIRQASERGRALARGLSPLPVGADGLAISLQELANRTAELFKIDCQFHYQKPLPVKDEAVGTHLYRIAQEAIANAVKHGRPKHVEIALGQNEDALILGVKDDGRGFPKRRKKKNNGMGLRVMNYRAGMIGGSIAIQHLKDGGTEVVCTVRRKHQTEQAKS